MQGTITIREARHDDGDVLGEIHAISWGVSHGPLCSPKVAAAGIEERRTKWTPILAERAASSAEATGSAETASSAEAKGSTEGTGWTEGTGSAEGTSWTEATGSADDPGSGDTILLALLDDRPGAFARFGASTSRPDLAEIHTLFAHPDAWGTGLAAALLTTILDQLPDAGYSGVHLWTLRDSAQARRFYAKNGFTETGRHHDHDFGEGPPLALIELERPLTE